MNEDARKGVKSVYEFGAFRLDAAERRFLHDGLPVHLPPKAFDMLLVLIQNNRRLVTKDELLDTVWKDSFVEENNLTQHIYTLRKILKTDNKEQYIETVARHGYRFNADIREIRDEAESYVVKKQTRYHIKIEERHEERTSFSGSRFLSRRTIAAAALLSVITLIVVYAILLKTKNSQAFTIKVKSIAALPFKVEDALESDEYLGLAIAEDLTLQLSNAKLIKVLPVPSIGKSKNSTLNPTEIGRLHNVEALITGLLKRSGKGLEATAQLIRTSDGEMVWSEDFEEQSGDLFKLNDAVAKKIAALVVSNAENIKLSNRRRAKNPDAFQSYIRGRAYWNQRTSEGIFKSIALFEKAIAQDPEFALAYAGLADAYAFDLEHWRKAEEFANKALALDPTLGEAQATIGFVRMFWAWDMAEAEKHFKLAVMNSPDYATAHQWYSILLAITGGRGSESEIEMQLALELDPTSSAINADMGQILYFMEEHDRAIEYCKKSLALNTSFVNAHIYLFKIYIQKKMYDEAIAEYFEVSSLVGPGFHTLAEIENLKKTYREKGINGFWKAKLDELKTKREVEDVIAECYAQLEEREPALHYLERAYKRHDFDMIYIRVNPVFKSYQLEPRFRKIADGILSSQQ